MGENVKKKKKNLMSIARRGWIWGRWVCYKGTGEESLLPQQIHIVLQKLRFLRGTDKGPGSSELSSHNG